MAIVIIILLGAIFGSFINMLIYRLPKMINNESISLIHPLNSICPHCKKNLKVIDLIPILSFVIALGRCRHCHKKIDISYLIVEIISVFSSVIIYFIIGEINYQLAFYLVLNYALLVLFFIDYKHQLLPDIVTIPMIWLGIIFNLLYGDLPSAVIGAVTGYLSLWTIYWIFKLITKKEGMGYGDFKLFSVIGAWFGYQILNSVILIAAILAILFYIIKIRSINVRFAFGPFMIIALPCYFLIL